MNPNARILVVDDFEMMRFVLIKGLKELGFTNIDEGADGSEAMAKLGEAADKNPYAVIFCDWNMPKATGLEVLSYCRVMPAYEKVPFVMVTAESETQNVVKAIKSGASDYIVKPISPEDLAVRLKKILAKAKLLAA